MSFIYGISIVGAFYAYYYASGMHFPGWGFFFIGSLAYGLGRALDAIGK